MADMGCCMAAPNISCHLLVCYNYPIYMCIISWPMDSLPRVRQTAGYDLYGMLHGGSHCSLFLICFPIASYQLRRIYLCYLHMYLSWYRYQILRNKKINIYLWCGMLPGGSSRAYILFTLNKYLKLSIFLDLVLCYMSIVNERNIYLTNLSSVVCGMLHGGSSWIRNWTRCWTK